MYFCFLDESNTPPKPSQKNRPPFFVVAGLFVPITQWKPMSQEFQRLKDRPEFRVRGEIKWRYFGTHNDDSKNTVRHLDQAARDDFRRRLYGIITSRNSVKVVAAIAKVDDAYSKSHINTQDDLYEYTYKPISERFQYHLQDMTRSTGALQQGIMVADHRDKAADERLRRHHQRLVHSVSPVTSKYDNFVESLFLAPSHHSLGIQLVDMVAGAIGRHFNSDDDTWMNEIAPAIRQGDGGSIWGRGLVKVPNNWEPPGGGRSPHDTI